MGVAEARTTNTEQEKMDAADRFANASDRALDLMFGIQRAMLEEVVFATTEVVDRARTETHLLAEFISKMAGSHSVKDIGSMCRECVQHQLDFIRRDCERVFRHGERMLETTSDLVTSQMPA